MQQNVVYAASAPDWLQDSDSVSMNRNVSYAATNELHMAGTKVNNNFYSGTPDHDKDTPTYEDI